MKLSLEWLEDFLEVPELEALCDALTEAGVEVEEISNPSADVQGVIIAEVKSCEAHPKADKLKVCSVGDGTNSYQVICGAPNVAQGQKVAFAAPGANLNGFAIAERAIRGVNSQGMLCSMEELGLAQKSDGIWVLPGDWPLGGNIFDQVVAKPVLTLWITPNRPDLLSHRGLSREVAAAFDLHRKGSSWRLVEDGDEARNYAKITIDDGEGCPRYCGRVIRGVTVGPSPEWLAARLESVGVRSINNVVDATNYVLMEYGHPLHAFDLDFIAKESTLPEIIVRRARDGEMMTTLDDVERKLDAADLVIADSEKVLALAGVMGAANSEVSETTQDVVLECAYFEPKTVRQSGRRHGLHTEASARFERGADPQALSLAIDRCAYLIADLAGGSVCRGVVEVSTYKDNPTHISLELSRVEKVLGISLSAEQVVDLLKPIEIQCESRNDGKLVFSRPSYRQDLNIEVDIIEEIARRYGYNNIPSTLPDSSQQPLDLALPPDRLDGLRKICFAHGLSETITYAFGKPTEHGEDSLRLLNALGEDFSALRTSLLPDLLKTVSHNLRHGQRDIRVFEIGTTFHAREAAADEDEKNRLLPQEDLRLGVCMLGGRFQGRWYEGKEEIDFSDLAGLLDNILDGLGSAESTSRVRGEHDRFNPHSVAKLLLGEEGVGFGGQLHPEFLATYDIDENVYAAEISLTKLLAAGTKEQAYRPLERLPGTQRDVALVADRSVAAEDLRRFIELNAAGGIDGDVVEDVSIFDVFAGKNLGENKVSIGFSIYYRGRGRTLRDEEVGGAFEDLLKKLEANFPVEVRA